VTKNHIITSSFLLLILLMTSVQLFPTTAAPLPDENTPSMIDENLREAIAASPERETTFLVRLRPEGGGSPEMAIDAQFRLEKMLDALGKRGGVRAYQAYYGENIIKITGGLGVLRLLEGWPELESVSLYQPGETWELRAQSSLDAEELNGSGLIIGKVTASDGVTPLTGIKVTAYRQVSVNEWQVAGSVFSNTSGDYVISGLASGIYRAKFEDDAGNYATEYYDNQTFFAMATNFNVIDGQPTPNINAAMAQAGKIAGMITLVGGGAASDVVASAWALIGDTWLPVANAVAGSGGAYTIGGLSPGIYRVRFADIYTPPRYLIQWYDGKLTVDDAQDITVTGGATVSNINAAMGSYGSITGNVKAYDETTNLADIDVDVYRWVDAHSYWEWESYGTTDGSGNYEAPGLVTETYRVQFTDSRGQFSGEFYHNQPDIDTANDVTVSLGYATPNINAQLALKTNTVDLSLVGGWNLISLPITLLNTAPADAFASIFGSYGDVFAYEACDTGDKWKVYNPTLPPPVNTLTEVSVRQGYWINMTTSDILTLSGTYPLETSITLCPGWNLIGYPSMTVQPVVTALASVAGKYTLVRQYQASDLSDPWKSYSPSVPPDFNDLKNLESGYGYWIYMTEAAILTVAGR
jgi:hypothetical protein